jgi:holo-[acyl-carrier protein] synthase
MRGVGTDIVDARRIARSLRRRAGFAEEVFSDQERLFCEAQRRPVLHYAARFAAKEAFLKALGLGIFSGVALRDIEVVGSPNGAHELRLGPSALSALEGVGGQAAFLSLSHARDLAVAFVVVP